MASTVFTFQNLKFVTKGTPEKSWPVAGATIILQENAIPFVVLRVDPVHTAGQADPVTVLDTLSKYAALNETVMQLALNYTKADFRFDVCYQDGTPEQSFEVTDWIITNAGFVTSAEGFGFELTLMHPMVMCNLFSSSFGGLITSDLDKRGIIGGADIPKSIAQALIVLSASTFDDQFLNKPCSAEAGGADIIAKFKTDMQRASDTLTTYLHWDPAIYVMENGQAPKYSPWPVGYTEAVGQGTAEAAMAQYLGLVFAGVKSSNIWDAIAQYVLNSWFVTVVPTWWKTHLTMVPSSPWLDPMVNLLDKNIASLDFPSFERNRMSGVYCTFSQSNYQDNLTFEQPAPKLFVDGVLYRPASDLDGQLVDISAPDWFMNLLKDFSNLTNHYGPTATSGLRIGPQIDDTGSQSNLAADDGAAQKQVFEQERCVLYRCAQQAFMSQFRAASQIKIATRLLLISDVGARDYVCPGFVCRVLSGLNIDEATKVLDFYITQVVHQIRFDAGVANTTIAGKYVRPVEGMKTASGKDIITQPENPVYKISESATA